MALAAALVVAGTFYGVYHAGHNAGDADCRSEHLAATIETNERLKKLDAKIDNNKPDGSDRNAAVEWLFNYTRQ